MDEGCPHCAGGFGLARPLASDGDFWVVCDMNPLVGGHILIISRAHASCAGAFSDHQFVRYQVWYEIVEKFLKAEYGSVAAFEHGVAGQTVAHAHTHLLPFAGTVDDIVPEAGMRQEISSLAQIRAKFAKNGAYLFAEIRGARWLVDTALAYPRFFRERFGNALGAPERADWKKAQESADLTRVFEAEIGDLERRWKRNARAD
jgi:diadenosine tetraphosphate (Ap4A) HIT family hydrolase